MKKVFLILAVAMLAGQLAGCGAARQAAAKRDMGSVVESMSVEYADKRLDPIRGKVPFGQNKNIIPTAVPDECPNNEEKEAINILREKVAIAKSKFSSINDKYEFRDAPITLNAINATDFNLGRLYKCQLTFQSYAEAWKRVSDIAEEDLAKIKYQVGVENQIRSEQAAAAIGAALQGAGAAIQQQEAIRQANKPRQTICRRIGDSVNCTTY